MRSSFKTALIAASLATALTAMAQPAASNRSPASAPCSQDMDCPMQEWREQRGMRHQPLTAEQHHERFNANVTEQAKILQITAAQRPQWDAYVQARKSMFTDMYKQRQEMWDPNRSPRHMTADHHAEWRAQHMETASQHMRQVANRTKELRDVLSPEQRTRFDQMGMRNGHSNGQQHGRSKFMQGGTQKPTTPASKP